MAEGRENTRVVTFRVKNEEYSQLEEVKAQTGLSNADLVMLGAGIAQEARKAKLAEISGLEARLAQVKASVRQTEQALDKELAEEKKRRLAELDIEIAAFKLFDLTWSPEEVCFKLGIPQPKALDYFQTWAEERKDKDAAQRELLRACLKAHLRRLQDERLWYGFRPLGLDPYKNEIHQLDKQIDRCRHLLSNPDQIDNESKQFLLAEYLASMGQRAESKYGQ